MKKTSVKNLIILIIFLLGFVDFYFRDSEYSVTGKIIGQFNYNKGVKIANWNLQIFGVTKASDEELMNFYKDKINDYDIIFIQEIRDSTNTAFDKLCSLLNGYGCFISSRAGRTSSKEQYGLIYNKSIKMNYFKDYNPDKQNRWERPPIEVSFDFGNYNLTVFNIHIKPDDVKNELNYLDDVALNKDYTMVLGDFNMGCSYYNNYIETEFDDWNFIIKDNDDTTSGYSDCAYDRIIVSNQLKDKVIKHSIEKDIKKEQSDHYLVWVEIKS